MHHLLTIFDQEAYVVLQILWFSFLAMVIAIPIYKYVQKTSPELGWNYHGNVPTSQFKNIDILGVALSLGLLIYATCVRPFTDPAKIQEVGNMSDTVLLIVNIVAQIVPAAIALVFLGRSMNVFEALGLQRPDWKRIGIVVLLGMVAIQIFATISGVIAEPFLKSAFGEKKNQDAVQMLLDIKASNPKLLILVAFTTIVVAPICEEIVFRGYFYAVMKRHSCRFFAAIITGLIFALVHGSMWSLAPLIVVGIILAAVYEFSGSLWASIICHSIFNAMSTIYMIFYLDANSLPH